MSTVNLKLLNDEILALPCVSDEKHFPAFVNKRLSKYLEHIKSFEGEIGKYLHENYDKIAELSKSIEQAINLYYEGFPSRAYFEFGKGMDTISDNLAKQKRNVSVSPRDVNFYRGRIGRKKLTPEEMFHIPFERRDLIKTNRYSIPGSPCLYVSDSIYTCWCELGKPPLEDIQFVRMDIDYKYLDLSFTKDALALMYKTAAVEKEMEESMFDDWVINFLLTWPLSLACYVKVSSPTSIFKPEYIIPQMLLEWIRVSSDLDGIKYFSTHTIYNKGKNNLGSFNNYAIPIKKYEESGLCPKLKYDIKISPVYSWSELITDNSGLRDKVFEKDERIERMFYHPSIGILEKEDKKLSHYINFEFAKIEYALQKMIVSKLK